MSTKTRGLRILVLILSLSLALATLPQASASAMPGQWPGHARFVHATDDTSDESEEPTEPTSEPEGVLADPPVVTEPLPPAPDSPPAEALPVEPAPVADISAEVPAESAPAESPDNDASGDTTETPDPVPASENSELIEAADTVESAAVEVAAATEDEQQPADSGDFTAAAVPIAVDDVVTTHQGESIQIRLLDNDTDADGDNLDLVSVSGNSGGSVGINDFGNGIVTFTPAAGFVGAGGFTYVVTDGTDTDTGAVTVNVTNTPPVAGDDLFTVQQGTSLQGMRLLDNDTDADGDDLDLVNRPAATSGSVGVNDFGNGIVSFTPNAGFVGIDTFTYIVTDGAATDTGTVTVEVTNTPPVANDDGVTAHQGTPTQIRLLDNDADADGDDLDLVNRSAATNGSVFINSFGDGIVTYTANAGFVGTDTFTYVITDGAATDTGTVTVTVTNTPPIANDDSVTTSRDTAILIRLLDNDTDADGNDLDLVSRSAATNGSVSINSFGEGTVNYTPGAGFVGTATFTYIMSDGAATDEATVTVTVTAVNAPPVATDDTATTLHGRSVTIPVLANDTGDALTIDGVSAPASNRADVVVNPDGTVTYTPDPGVVQDPVSPTLQHAFLGPDQFTYTISDGTDTAIGTVSVTVTNTLPVAVDFALATAPGVPLTIDLLADNVDPDGDPLLAFAGGVPVATGSVTTVEQGIIRYDPAPGFEGEVQVYYFIWDGAGISEAFVTICVGDCDPGGNAPPVAVDDQYTTTAGVSLTARLLDNDTDADADGLEMVSAGTADGLTVVVDDLETGVVTITPDPGFVGTASFTYVVTDIVATDTGTVTVTVTAAPDPPAPDPDPDPDPPVETPKAPKNEEPAPKQPTAKPAPKPATVATTLPDTGIGTSIGGDDGHTLPMGLLLVLFGALVLLRRASSEAGWRGLHVSGERRRTASTDGQPVRDRTIRRRAPRRPTHHGGTS